MSENNVQIRDEETGELVWVTKQTYDAMRYWRQKMRDYINPEKVSKGTIVITSTFCDENNGFENLWTNNE